MALHVFLTAAAGTKIISTNLWTYFNWFLFYRLSWLKIIIFVSSIILTGSFYLRFITAQFTHVGLLLSRSFLHLYRCLWLLLFHWYFGMAEEVNDIFIHHAIH